MQCALTPETFRKFYRDFAEQNPKWNEIPSSTGDIYQWDEKSDYIHDPPFFENFSMEPGHIAEIRGARALGIFGDTVTTDHISPAGAIKESSPAGKYLMSRGIQPRDFNSYGSRRGNDLVMTRGTFANVRIKNLMVPGTEGGVTKYYGSATVPVATAQVRHGGFVLWRTRGSRYLRGRTDVDLRCGDEIRGNKDSVGHSRRSRIRDRFVARLGSERDAFVRRESGHRGKL